MSRTKPKYVDLFAGCGGLSLGLAKAGFESALSLEKSPMAGETYYHNFINNGHDSEAWHRYLKQPMDAQFRQGLVVNDIQAVLENASIMGNPLLRNIDLVAGGPPCQGFSMAGRRNPNDGRNHLPWLFLRFVALTSPKAVLIENVPGISQDFEKQKQKAPFRQLTKALERTGTGYKVQAVKLNAMHYGVPQFRQRIFIFGIRSDIADKKKMGVVSDIWSSDDYIQSRNWCSRPFLAPEPVSGTNNVHNVHDALFDLGNEGYIYDAISESYGTNGGNYARSMRFNVKAKSRSNRDLLFNHIARHHSARVIMRFRLYQYLSANNVPAGILNLPRADHVAGMDVARILKTALAKAKLPAIAPDHVTLARDIDELIDLINELSTLKNSQRALSWDRPSPTVLSLPDDLIHPSIPRALTVREMARLQSFPDNFKFWSKETTGGLHRRHEVPQYTQVGNAVPPLLAFEIGKTLRAALAD